MISIPPGATPADVVGDTEILAGQSWLNPKIVEKYAQWMVDGTFPWEFFQKHEPMAYQHGANGLVLTQGHHRWVAARLARVEIPVKITIHRDFWPGDVAYAVHWSLVVWSEDL